MSSDNHFEQSLLDKIKTRHLAPKPRWRFLLSDYAVWGTGALALVIGGVSSYFSATA